METRVDVEFDGVHLTGYSTDYVINKIRDSRNYYEIDILERWLPIIKEAKYIFDIGANLGNHSVYWGKRIPNAIIFSYEPYADNYQLLEKNIEDNHLKNVVVINKAIGRHNGYVVVKEFDKNNYGGTVFEESEEQDSSVLMASVDDEMLTLGIPQIDFVKIDTEGFEIDVLQGMRATIQKHHPAIWVECSEDSICQIANQLKADGYTLYDLNGANVFFVWGNCCPVVMENDVLFQRFMYLKKTNSYYSDSIRLKSWLKDKDIKINEAEERINKLNANLSLAIDSAKNNEEKYLTCKKWLDDKNMAYETLQKTCESQNKDYEVLLKKYDDCKVLLVDKENEINGLKITIKDIKEETDNYRTKLKDAVLLMYDNEKILIETKRKCEDYNKRFAEVSNRLAEDERKLGILHSHWYWRFGLNVYLWLKRIKHKAFG